MAEPMSETVIEERDRLKAEVERLADRLRAIPTVYMDGVEAVPVDALRRVLAEQDGGDRG